MRARVDLICQVFHEDVKERQVGVSVQNSKLLTVGVFEFRVEGVPVKKDLTLNSY